MSPDGRAHRRISVLLVEDNPDHSELIRRRLRDVDIDLRRVATGREALESLEGVDLVLLDYSLPDMTGLETLRSIMDVGGPSVVMVTGMGSEEVAVDAMRTGAVDYVVKDENYLRFLPEIVERAWNLHDLARRAGQLQHLALLINSAEDRDTIFSEIVRGALELLGADTCALAVLGSQGLEVGAVTGPVEQDETVLLERARRVLGSDTTLQDSTLLVPLTRRDEDPLGVLVVVGPAGRSYPRQELQLAETFAAFAATALRNLRRHELERDLITELQQALEIRRDFVNSVSHELRTPLASIAGFSATLTKHWGRLDEETITTSIEKIEEQAGELASLVDRLLDFSSLEHGRFEPEIRPVLLARELEPAVASLRSGIGDRRISVELDPLEVLADPHLLRQTVTYLISNAVKFSPPDSSIVLRAFDSNGSARVEVADEGVGLTKEEIDRVFAPFWRADRSIKQATRGAGLGLALAREYVRTMGGDIGVESEPGKGSTFYFTLPLA